MKGGSGAKLGAEETVLFELGALEGGSKGNVSKGGLALGGIVDKTSDPPLGVNAVPLRAKVTVLRPGLRVKGVERVRAKLARVGGEADKVVGGPDVTLL
jgi:hypothetical protein